MIDMQCLSHRSDIMEFHKILEKCKNILILTGAGISAESGIPTFRGAGGLWRKYEAQSLATHSAFKRSPSLVWEFYHYRRELVLTKSPNKAHYAIAKCERLFQQQGRKITLVTQNVDELHVQAGSENVIELHGSLFKTRCTKCGKVESNRKSPICPSLNGRGDPGDNEKYETIPVDKLPRCSDDGCNGLLRPHIVWFGESLFPECLQETQDAMEQCDLCLVIGTSSVVQPAASFAPYLSSKGIPVAEFNLDKTPVTSSFKFHFEGLCSETVPKALKMDID